MQIQRAHIHIPFLSSFGTTGRGLVFSFIWISHRHCKKKALRPRGVFCPLLHLESAQNMQPGDT